MKTQYTPAHRRRAFLVLLLSCLALLVQSAVLIHTRWVEDENWLGSEAATFAREGRLRYEIFPSSIRNTVDVSPPLHTLSMAASFKAFGVGIGPARAVSALAAMALVVVVFFLAYDISGPLCAGLAALLTATDTFLLIAARTARPEALVALLGWLALLLFYRGMRTDSSKLFLLSGVACGIGVVTHPLALPFAGSIGVFFLARYRWSVLRRPFVWLFALGVAAPIGVYVAWCFQDAAHIASYRDVYVAKAAESFRQRLLGEADRWGDFIGLSTQRVSLPVRIPVRLHIAVILVAAFGFLSRRRRDLAIPMLVVLFANILWWMYLVNKGPRYLVMIAPVFAILLAYLTSKARELRAQRVIFAAVALVLVTQAAANAFWLYKFRTANYAAVGRELRQIIPPGAKVYGASTFWMALHDHPYYAFDRTKLDYAVEKLQPEYMILYDRVMVNGSGHGEDDFAGLRQQATDFVRAHGTLAGTVSNSFYGDLQVFRVRY